MSRRSRKTCSVGRARGGGSPLPQALKRFVISAVRASIEPIPPGHQQIYTKKVAGFGGPLPPVSADGETKSHHDLLQKAGITNETHSNYGADAQSRYRKRLRTTSRQDEVFGNWRGRPDRSKAAGRS